MFIMGLKKMSDYKNIFNKLPSKKYKNLFDNDEENNVEKKENILGNNIMNQDSRHNEILAINDKIPSNTVILWIDNFSENLQKIGEYSVSIADDSMNLIEKLQSETNRFYDFFDEVKSTIKWIFIPKEKQRFSFFSRKKDNFEIQFTPQLIDDIKNTIRNLVKEYDDHLKYGEAMFLKKEVDNKIKEVYDTIKMMECGKVALTYLYQKGLDIDEYNERLVYFMHLFSMQLASHQSSLNTFMSTKSKYEHVKTIVIPLLLMQISQIVRNESNKKYQKDDPSIEEIIKNLNSI